jgi:hypothetical protein
MSKKIQTVTDRAGREIEVVTRCAYKRKKRPCGIPDVLVPDPKELKGTEALAGLMDHNRQFKGRGGKG